MSAGRAFARDQLKALVERIERLQEEKKALADDIRDVYAEAKANGFDVKALRSVVGLRRLDAAERAEQAAVLETYLLALGMLPEAPAGPAPDAKPANPAKARARAAARKDERLRGPAPRAAWRQDLRGTIARGDLLCRLPASTPVGRQEAPPGPAPTPDGRDPGGAEPIDLPAFLPPRRRVPP